MAVVFSAAITSCAFGVTGRALAEHSVLLGVLPFSAGAEAGFTFLGLREEATCAFRCAVDAGVTVGITFFAGVSVCCVLFLPESIRAGIKTFSVFEVLASRAFGAGGVIGAHVAAVSALIALEIVGLGVVLSSASFNAHIFPHILASLALGAEIASRARQTKTRAINALLLVLISVLSLIKAPVLANLVSVSGCVEEVGFKALLALRDSSRAALAPSVVARSARLVILEEALLAGLARGNVVRASLAVDLGARRAGVA